MSNIAFKCYMMGFAAFWLALSNHAAQTQGDPERPLYIIFDGSNSMWGELADEKKTRKITAAKDVFARLNQSVFAGRSVALRLYGHRRAKDCADTELAVPFTAAAGAKEKIAKVINAVTPRGKTPITRSLTAALKDFDGRGGDILLISDGIETCDSDPCELVAAWQTQDIDIKVHVVGLGLNEMARAAMQCIAETSGTDYMDAQDVDALGNAIETTAQTQAPAVGQANPQPQDEKREFKITGLDADGKYLPVRGTINQPDTTAEEIKSNSRYVFAGGDYTITVGVPTLSGEIYKPITQSIKVKDTGTTHIEVTLARPPLVETRFLENGKEVRGTTAYAFVNDKQTFSLRFGEEHFVMPGTYEFRAGLRTDNSDLRVTESIVDGEDKVIVFSLIETVHTYFKVTNMETGKRLRQHQELWQNGELKYKIHHANGAKVQPGTYTLKSESVHTPYQIDNVVVPAGAKQTLEFAVQLGKAKVYLRVPESAHIDPKTGLPKKKKDWRCWFYRMQGEKKSSRSGTMQSCDGREIYFAAGRYFVYPTKTYGKFLETYFDVKAGKTTEVDVVLEN